MGYLKDIANLKDPQGFPGATFEATGEIPAAQCTDYRFEADDGVASTVTDSITVPHDLFKGYDLTGKKVTVTASSTGWTGTFDILTNAWARIYITVDIPNAVDVVFFCHNGGSMILTRSAKSLMQYVLAAGYAATMKSGKLYTDMPSNELENACSVIFDPLT